MKNICRIHWAILYLFLVFSQVTLAVVDELGANQKIVTCNTTTTQKMKDRIKNWKNPNNIPSNTVLVVLAGGFSRSCEAANFYKKHHPINIIVTGWPKQVENMVRNLVAEGVPKNILIEERQSRNTRDHAWFVNEIIHNRYPVRPPVVLLTDIWHMQRAEDYFSAYGFPVDYVWGSDPSLVAHGDPNLGTVKCFKAKNPVDPYSKVAGEARAYNDVGLCHGLFPRYRNNRPYDRIALKLTLSTKEYVEKCESVVAYENSQSSSHQLDPKFCLEVPGTLQNLEYTYQDSINCLTESKIKNWGQRTRTLCRDKVRSDFFRRANTIVNPSNYVLF